MPGIRGNFNFKKVLISFMSICLIRSFRKKTVFTLLYLGAIERYFYEALGSQVSDDSLSRLFLRLHDFHGLLFYYEI